MAAVGSAQEKLVVASSYQQIHKGCGGELILIAKAGGASVRIMCKTCRSVWGFTTMGAPTSTEPCSEWEGFQEPQ